MAGAISAANLYTYVTLIFLLCAAFGIWASVIARRKGRRQAVWFIAGFFTWVIAAFLLYLMPVAGRGGKVSRWRRQRAMKTKVCWRCRGVIPVDAPSCPGCGAKSSGVERAAS